MLIRFIACKDITIEFESKKRDCGDIISKKENHTHKLDLFRILKIMTKHPNTKYNESTWYSLSRFLKLKHHFHFSYEKSIIEKTIH